MACRELTIFWFVGAYARFIIRTVVKFFKKETRSIDENELTVFEYVSLDWIVGGLSVHTQATDKVVC